MVGNNSGTKLKTNYSYDTSLFIMWCSLCSWCFEGGKSKPIVQGIQWQVRIFLDNPFFKVSFSIFIVLSYIFVSSLLEKYVDQALLGVCNKKIVGKLNFVATNLNRCCFCGQWQSMNNNRQKHSSSTALPTPGISSLNTNYSSSGDKCR